MLCTIRHKKHESVCNDYHQKLIVVHMDKTTVFQNSARQVKGQISALHIQAQNLTLIISPGC